MYIILTLAESGKRVAFPYGEFVVGEPDPGLEEQFTSIIMWGEDVQIKESFDEVMEILRVANLRAEYPDTTLNLDEIKIVEKHTSVGAV